MLNTLVSGALVFVILLLLLIILAIAWNKRFSQKETSVSVLEQPAQKQDDKIDDQEQVNRVSNKILIPILLAIVAVVIVLLVIHGPHKQSVSTTAAEVAVKKTLFSLSWLSASVVVFLVALVLGVGLIKYNKWWSVILRSIAWIGCALVVDHAFTFIPHHLALWIILAIVAIWTVYRLFRGVTKPKKEPKKEAVKPGPAPVAKVPEKPQPKSRVPLAITLIIVVAVLVTLFIILGFALPGTGKPFHKAKFERVVLSDTTAFLESTRLYGNYYLSVRDKLKIGRLSEGKIIAVRVLPGSRIYLPDLCGVQKAHFFPHLNPKRYPNLDPKKVPLLNPDQGMEVTRDTDPKNLLYPKMLGGPNPKCLWPVWNAPVDFPVIRIGRGQYVSVAQRGTEWIILRSLSDGIVELKVNLLTPRGSVPYLWWKATEYWQLEIRTN